ncbi:MAG TPA: dolichyl-phosphate beta-glucosyltransferase [Thermomicrobiales bacterium]|nr:dolichyl-phosphate beta-glucosyltransferase [Thermomicrobiales bacterium]
MSSEPNGAAALARPGEPAAVEIVIPVYNEAPTLAANVATLRDFLAANAPYRWRVVIADNASTDDTLAIARDLAASDARVGVLHLERKGRGRALKAAWLASEAAVVAYMDVDLSTNLAALPPLLAPLLNGEADVAIGSRLARGAVVMRQWKRETLSRGYNLLIRGLFRPGFADAQCGFKALTRAAAQALLPTIENDEWFFDTELLLLAAARGDRIREVPVEWVEDLDSRVDIPRTIAEDLRGLWRMRRRRDRHPAAAPVPGSPGLAARSAGRSSLP